MRHDLQHQRLDQRFERFVSTTTAKFDPIDARLGGVDGRLVVLGQQMTEVQQGLATVIDLVSRRPAGS